MMGRGGAKGHVVRVHWMTDRRTPVIETSEPFPPPPCPRSNCGNQDVIGTPESRYPVMRDALNASGRPIFFAACEWAVDFPATWMAPVANCERGRGGRVADPCALPAPTLALCSLAHDLRHPGARVVQWRLARRQGDYDTAPALPPHHQNLWECVVPHVDWTNVYAPFAGPGHFNDMDVRKGGGGGVCEKG